MQPVTRNKKIAILQSNYIPWKGYFDIINSVDEFVIYDDAQYTRRDWRNRNIIKTKDGLRWLTIPVEVKGKYDQKIKETKIADKEWASKHWKKIKLNYGSAPYFKDYTDLFEESYHQCEKLSFLSDVNRLFINVLNSILGIHTPISDSSKYKMEGGKNEKIISICKQANAKVYVTGPSAKDYINEELFFKSGITLRLVDYKGYPEYNQIFPPFEHNVSIIDVIFNCGNNTHSLMKSFL
jgi:hypothetical protein